MSSRQVKCFVVVIIMSLSLVSVSSLADVSCLKVTGVSGGEDHGLVLAVDKTVWGCGGNMYGPLGNNEYGEGEMEELLVQVHGEDDDGLLPNIVAISAGRSGRHSLAADSSPTAEKQHY